MDCRYTVRDAGELIVLEVSGEVSLDDIAAMDRVFWAAFDEHHTRILMDWSGVSGVRVQVQDFMDMGLTDRARRRPAGDRLRAAYVSSEPLVRAYLGMAVRTWSSHLAIALFDSTAEAADWLDVSAGQLAALAQRATG